MSPCATSVNALPTPGKPQERRCTCPDRGREGDHHGPVQRLRMQGRFCSSTYFSCRNSAFLSSWAHSAYRLMFMVCRPWDLWINLYHLFLAKASRLFLSLFDTSYRGLWGHVGARPGSTSSGWAGYRAGERVRVQSPSPSSPCSLRASHSDSNKSAAGRRLIPGRERSALPSGF